MVQVDNQRRHILLPRTLASRRLLGAAFADQRLRVGFGEKEGMAWPAKEAAGGKKACCLVSEVLEEAGLDREKARRLRRQVLEGIILLCRWQLERMEENEPAPETGPRKARKVTIE